MIKKNEKITCVIVSYNAGPTLLATLPLTLEQVSDVIIVDNNSDAQTKEILEKLSIDYPGRIQLILNNKNLWFGKAANIGLKTALDNGANFLLQLNDDNYLSDGAVSNMVKVFLENPQKLTGIVSPHIIIDRTRAISSKDIIKKSSLIASAGMLVPREVFETIGFYDDQLIIGYEDYDYSLRAKYHGYHCFVSENSFLHANVGKIEYRKILWKKIAVFHYSPLRRYYAARNGLFILKRYHDKMLMRSFIWWELNALVGILFFEKDKVKKGLLTLLGYFDTCRNKMGILESIH